jgi:LPXTG-motif cell wall-anchored protein
MRRIRLFRLIAVATIATVFGFATPALADSTVAINTDHVPTTAEDFDKHECTGPLADLDEDQDGWHFVAPGQASFSSVTLDFHTPGGDVHVVITSTDSTTPSTGSGWEGFLDNAGDAEKHAYLITDAGWTLFSGSAEVSGETQDFFNLSHTCPGTPTDESPSPSPSTSESHDPGSPSPSISESTPPLPKTGTAIMSIALSGLGAVAVGAGILLVLRRRRDALLSGSDE